MKGALAEMAFGGQPSQHDTTKASRMGEKRPRGGLGKGGEQKRACAAEQSPNRAQRTLAAKTQVDAWQMHLLGTGGGRVSFGFPYAMAA